MKQISFQEHQSLVEEMCPSSHRGGFGTPAEEVKPILPRATSYGELLRTAAPRASAKASHPLDRRFPIDGGSDRKEEQVCRIFSFFPDEDDLISDDSTSTDSGQEIPQFVWAYLESEMQRSVESAVGPINEKLDSTDAEETCLLNCVAFSRAFSSGVNNENGNRAVPGAPKCRYLRIVCTWFLMLLAAWFVLNFKETDLRSLQLLQSHYFDSVFETFTEDMFCEKSCEDLVHGEEGMEMKCGAMSAMLRFRSVDADKLPDFSLEGQGGHVVATPNTTSAFTNMGIVVGGVPLWRWRSSPSMMLQPTVQPGNCWAFEGSEGRAVVVLGMPGRVYAITIEHIPPRTSLTGHINSAPKEFAVIALKKSADIEGEYMGTFVYNVHGPPQQTFFAKKATKHYVRAVQLHVLSNHGHKTYTCIYRFRVHACKKKSTKAEDDT